MKFLLMTQVWGMEFCHLFGSVVLPSFLSEGNIGSIDDTSEFLIFTTGDDAKYLKEFASIQSLEKTLTVRYEIIDNPYKNMYEVMNDCQEAVAIEAAERDLPVAAASAVTSSVPSATTASPPVPPAMPRAVASAVPDVLATADCSETPTGRMFVAFVVPVLVLVAAAFMAISLLVKSSSLPAPASIPVASALDVVDASDCVSATARPRLKSN